jgi:hypothetical protein
MRLYEPLICSTLIDLFKHQLLDKYITTTAFVSYLGFPPRPCNSMVGGACDTCVLYSAVFVFQK